MKNSYLSPFVLCLTIMITLAMSSCSTDKEEIPLMLSDATATQYVATIEVPAGAKVFYDFLNSTTADSAASMINLSGMYGSALKNSRADAYTMAYFDLENTSIEDLRLDVIMAQTLTPTNSFTIDATTAGAPPIGPTWIIYDFQNNHAVYPTANRYIVLHTGSTLTKQTDELYILNAASVTALRGNATYKINVRKYLKN